MILTSNVCNTLKSSSITKRVGYVVGNKVGQAAAFFLEVEQSTFKKTVFIAVVSKYF